MWLLVALRVRRLPFPHPGVLHDPRRLLTCHGLAVESDERRRFTYPLAETDDALQWVRSLYLPGVPPRRIRAAQRVARRWAGSSIGIPLRRLVAVRTGLTQLLATPPDRVASGDEIAQRVLDATANRATLGNSPRPAVSPRTGRRVLRTR
jgi:hypothetical protein